MQKIAVFNDLSGYGRCSMYTSISILSALKVHCIPIPTAILSNQTGYKKFYYVDFSEHIQKYTDCWKCLNDEFENIYVGFLGNKSQFRIVEKFIKEFKSPDSNIIIDTVMGDNEEIYPIFDNQYINQMRKLSQYANILTPNVTELYLLADKKISYDRDDIVKTALSIKSNHTKNIIVTGIKCKDYIKNVNIDVKTKESYEFQTPNNNISYSGTGDIFATIISGLIARNIDINKAINIATKFIYNAIKFTEKQNLSPNDGIMFENFLGELTSI